MQDEPTPHEILGSVITFLRDDVQPQLSGYSGFQMRVAINAIELVRRELAVTPAHRMELNAMLVALLAREGSTADLAAEFSRRIAERQIDPQGPAVERCLWALTDAKIEVDQPKYAGHLRAKAMRAAAK
ncbi:DUF6285 domain-containing protein [Novosphingobium sp. HII-3]|uniref:DUF6285 domain-containing protein n=1 Tax=Novosphingobium sp. HII-3 TaxID=2075565 RepID=UPI000CDB1ECE|nr:DUF6285 domain-containing protein [Novosphingobium sp. HII-3]